MKKGLLKVCSWILNIIGLVFSLPGVILICIGLAFADWADMIKEL